MGEDNPKRTEVPLYPKAPEMAGTYIREVRRSPEEIKLHDIGEYQVATREDLGGTISIVRGFWQVSDNTLLLTPVELSAQTSKRFSWPWNEPRKFDIYEFEGKVILVAEENRDDFFNEDRCGNRLYPPYFKRISKKTAKDSRVGQLKR